MKIRYCATALLLFMLIGQAALAETFDNKRFRIVDETMVIDSQNGLMWALRDNGEDIDWYGAKKYCEDFSAGGYTDWRMPDIEELADLYSGNGSNEEGYAIAGPFQITDCCIWSSYDTMGGALAFSFKSGKKPALYLTDTYQLRALPVREMTKREQASTK